MYGYGSFHIPLSGRWLFHCHFPFIYSISEISCIRFFCINIFLSNFFRVLDRSYKKVPQKNREISNSDILYIRKLVRIGSNARIPGDSHCEDKEYCSYFSKKIEMVKIAIPNFCINFLNKTVKSLSILCDFAVASLADAWIKTDQSLKPLLSNCSRILRGCVD